MYDRGTNIMSTKNPNLALIRGNHNVLWKIGFCTVAIIFSKNQKRVAHGNDALCRNRLLGTKIAQT